MGSSEKIMNVSPSEVPDADEGMNIFYSRKKAPNKLQSFIPQICELIIGEQKDVKSIEFSSRIVTKPLGQIRLNCLELLTVAIDLAEFECGEVLELLSLKFWSA